LENGELMMGTSVWDTTGAAAVLGTIILLRLGSLASFTSG
jgi:hypothetical protein